MICPAVIFKCENFDVECGKESYKDSLHCREHDVIFKSIYRQYKSLHISDILMMDNIQLETLDLCALLHNFNKLDTVYKLRLRHLYGFVRLKWDAGHIKSIMIILNKMIEINKILSKMFPLNYAYSID